MSFKEEKIILFNLLIMRNGCGGEKGFKFIKLKNRLIKLPLVDKKRLDSLYNTIEERCCNPHDDAFTIGGGIIDFIKANYVFCETLMNVLHWSTPRARMGIFIIMFIGLNTLGIKYFNWNIKGKN